jgi:hypothetical protein
MSPVILLCAAFLLAPPAAKPAAPFSRLQPRLRLIRQKPCRDLAESKERPVSLKGWKLRYRVSNLGIRLGEMTARIRGEHPQKTTVSIACRLKGIFTRLLSRRLEQKGVYSRAGPVQVNTAVGKKSYRLRIEKDGRKATAVMVKKDGESKRTKKRTYRRRCGIRDAVGLLLHLRTRKLEPGTRLNADVLVGRRLWRVDGQVEKKQTCRTAAGDHPCIRLSGTARRTGRKEPVGLVLWLSDDQWRLPLRTRVEHSLGDLELELLDSQKTVTKRRPKSASRSGPGSPQAPVDHFACGAQ